MASEQMIHTYEMLQDNPDSAYLPAEKTEAFMLHPDRDGLILVVGDFRTMEGVEFFEHVTQQIKQGYYATIDVEDMM